MSYEAWGEPDDDRFEAAREAGWLDPTDITKALLDVMNERNRQWDVEGFTPEHDDKYVHGELADAAACYAFHHANNRWRKSDSYILRMVWPWAERWWKPTTRRRDLVKAGALILAEIERLDRLT